MRKLSLPMFLLLTSATTFAQEKTALSVNGESITKDEYFRRMEYLPGLGRVTSKGDFSEQYPAVAALDTLITELLVLQVAKEKGVSPTEAEIDFEIGYRARLSPKLLDSWTSSGRTVAEYRALLKVEIAQFKLQTLGQTYTDKEISDLYELSKESDYTVPMKLKLRVITVKSQKDAEQIDKELKAGKTFEALATLYSTDENSRLAGGYFGEIQPEFLSEDARKEVTSLKKGEMSKWVKADAILAKFLVQDIIPKVVRPLDDVVKEDLKRQFLLRRGKQKNDVSKWIREARAKAKINISNPSFQKAYDEFVEKERRAFEQKQKIDPPRY
jgi:foldase protein PrsA